MSSRTAATPMLLGRRSITLSIAALFLATSMLVGCSPEPDDINIPKAATSSERIAAALAAGEIDEPTSMLYQTWAQFGDRSLPEQYRGAPEPHDLSILNEVQDSLESLPTDIRSQIAPFFERPSSPDSAFSEPANANGSAGSGTAQGLAVKTVAQIDNALDIDIDVDGPQRCQQDWISHAVPDLPFRVWACPDDGNAAAESRIATVSDAVSARVGPMLVDAPLGMGAPIPDLPNADVKQPSDDKIDIYVLPHGWLAPYRDLNERRMDEMAAAITMRAAPRTENNASSYMLLGAYMLDYPDPLERVLVHEVFHVLQYAHFAGDGQSTAWVAEAGARWAETYFAEDYPDFSWKVLIEQMQASELSLLDDQFEHRYLSFFWFMFMQQEVGPEAVFGVWHALDSPAFGASNESVVAAINSQIDLETAFPEFAMRLLNADLPGNPISTRLSQLTPNFADGVMPTLAPHPFNADVLDVDYDGVSGLAYRYTRVTLPDAAASGTSVSVAANLRTPSGVSPSIEALVQGPDGDYSRVSIDPTGTPVCVGSELVLVVANPSGKIDDEASGTIELVRNQDSECVTPAPIPSPSATPSTPPESDNGVTRDFCTDMLQFQRDMEGLANGTDLPITSERVTEMFDLPEPYLPNLPDGGIEQIEILHSYADQAADQSASSAATIFENEEFQRLTNAIAFLVQYCPTTD